MDEELVTIEETFDRLPEEVKLYVYSPSFSDSIKKFCAENGLTEAETVQFTGALYNYITQLESEDELLKTIHSVSKTPQVNQKMIDWVKALSNKILELVTNAYLNEEEEASETGSATNTEAVPNSAFSSIENQLNKPSTVAPITRDYSIGKGETSSPVETPRTPVVDIYREIPEK